MADADRTHKAYVYLTAQKTGATLTNFGHSGDDTARLLYIVSNGRFGTAPSSAFGPISLCDDYSNTDLCSIAILTNDVVREDFLQWEAQFNALVSLECGKSLQNLPFDKGGTTYTTPEDYFALYPDNSPANLCKIIEWMRYKNPKMQIVLITPIPRGHATLTKYTMDYAEDLLTKIGRRYSCPVIHLHDECGIDFQNLTEFTAADKTHPNEIGHRIIADYVSDQFNLMANRIPKYNTN